jgi:hypothetical protein
MSETRADVLDHAHLLISPTKILQQEQPWLILVVEVVLTRDQPRLGSS